MLYKYTFIIGYINNNKYNNQIQYISTFICADVHIYVFILHRHFDFQSQLKTKRYLIFYKIKNFLLFWSILDI